jgi:lysozyme family protein
MSTDAFNSSLPFILRWEGGYVNHPADPGGATNRGVTQKVYDTWRRAQGQPTQDVRQLSDAEMHSIYEGNYWKLDLAQFDTAVNMGTGRAVRFLQAAVGCEVDGGFGEGTLKAVKECNDLAKTLVNYCNERGAYYDRLVAANPKLAVFQKGWSNRLNALRKEVGLPGFEADVPLDFGDTDHVQRVPDIGVDASYDL